MVCRAAAAANPALVKQLNAAAVACVGQIVKEIASEVGTRRWLSDLGNSTLRFPKQGDTDVVLCKLEYFKNARMVETPSGGSLRPNDDGVVLIISIYNIVAQRQGQNAYRCDYGEVVLVNGIELNANYFLELGRLNKEVEGPMRVIIAKHLKQYCADALKMK